MRRELLQLSRETLIYGTSTVITRFLNFLLVPFYVNALASSAEYGIVSSLYAWVAFLLVIYPLGLEGAFFRYASRGENEAGDTAREKTSFSTAQNIILLWSLFLSAAIMIAAPVITEPLFRNPKTDITEMIPMLETIIRTSAGILLFDALAVIPFAFIRLEHKAKRFASIKIINILITLGLNFYFILSAGLGVRGIFYANLIASAVTFLLLLPNIIPLWQPVINKADLRKMLPFGLTNVPAYLGAMMVQVIDRPIVQMYLGLAAVGIYQANYRMGFMMMVFVSLFEYAWRPFFMRQHKTNDEKARHIFSMVFTYFMLASFCLFLLLSFFLPVILTTPLFGRTLLRADYLEGMHIIPIILAAYIFQGMYTNFIAGIYIAERHRVLPLVTGLGAGVNIIVNLLLIPPLGMIGAAYATLAAYIVMAAALYRYSQQVYTIEYQWRRILVAALITVTAFALERMFAVYLDAALLNIGRILLALISVAAMIQWVITADERRGVKEILMRKRG